MRAEFFTQGSFAAYNRDDVAGPLTASGGDIGGGFRGDCRYVCNSNGDDVIGSLCARDFKGVSSQYVREGKVVLLELLP